MSKEDLRGVFFILKGQYKKCKPSVTSPITGDQVYLGGYDPHDPSTEEWYMCIDNKTFNCISCGSDLDKVITSVYRQIVKYKDLKHYTRALEKRDGAKVSEHTVFIRQALLDTYGTPYEDLIREQEDLAYEHISGQTPIKRARKVAKVNTLVTPPTSGKVETPPVQKKFGKIKPKKVVIKKF